MQAIEFIFSIAILIMSVVIHEVSHGFVAYAMGDPTAKHQGRLTLNPLVHLDPFGSVLLPVLTYMFGGFIIGWARPVPYNPYNLSNQKWGPALVGAAGPASNIFVALVFGLLLRFSGTVAFLPAGFLQLAVLIVFINILLAVFNLVPIPPLDGSKVLFALLPYRWTHIQYFLERYGLIVLIFFIFFLWRIILPVVFFVFQLIVGSSPLLFLG